MKRGMAGCGGKYSNEFAFGCVEIEILVEMIPELRRGVDTRVKI